MFDLYAENLRVVKHGTKNLVTKPDLDDIVICPICFKYFTQVAIETKELSIEHVPPQVVGGKERTITCRNCNNSASPLNKRFSQQLNFTDFRRGKVGASSPIDSWFTINRITIPVNVSIDENGGWNIVPRQSNPNDLANLNKLFESKEQDLDLKLTVNTFKDEFSWVDMLRSAYLWTFSILGYSFLVNPNLQLIRDQIQSPNKKLLADWGVVGNRIPDEFLGLNLIYRPSELRCFLAVFDVTSSNGEVYRPVVMLPGPTEPGNTIYDWLAENKSYDISVRKIAEPDDINAFITQPFATYDIWNTLERE